MKIVLACVLGALVSSVAMAGTPPAMPPSNFGGARAINADTWYSADDYPMAAIRAHEQGVVTIRFDIGVDGKISNCAVAQSSGSATLDAVPCKKLTRKARFKPARDAWGAPIVAHGVYSMSFWLP